MRITLSLIEERPRISLIVDKTVLSVKYSPIDTGRYIVTYATMGERGVPGKSGYEIIKEKGYEGTEDDFAKMLISIKDKQDKIEIGNPMVSLLDLYNLGKL